MELFCPPLSKPIYIMRHGLSAGQVAAAVNRDRADSHIGLVPTGFAQAKLGAEKFWQAAGDKRILIVSSDYQRADETAQVVIKAAGDKNCDWLRYRSELVEIHFGMFEGLSREEQEQHHPIEAKHAQKFFQEDSLGAAYYRKMPHGDSYAELGLRFLNLAALLRDKGYEEKYDTFLFVAHGGTMRAIAKVWNSLSVEEFSKLKIPIIALFGGYQQIDGMRNRKLFMLARPSLNVIAKVI